MEYSEEEKKAIEILDTFEFRRKTINYNKITLEDSQSAKTLLNLIEKQQKEIDRLTNGRNFLFDKICAQNWTPEMFNRLVEENYVPKEAIREKIEKLKEELPLIGNCKNDCEKCFKRYRGSNFVYCYAYHQIKILKELLGE